MSKENTVPLPLDEDDYYDVSEYVYPDFEGVFKGELAYTRWGKHHNKIAFINLEDGRKIICSTWNRKTNFFNLNVMAYGTEIEIALKRNSRGRICLIGLNDLSEYYDVDES